MRSDPNGQEPAGGDRLAEWAALGEWLSAPPPLLHEVDVAVLRERVGFIGRARSTLAAMEAELVGEIARREGDAAAEEMLRRDQKRSRSGARKAVKTAGQLEWAPSVAEKLAEGAITPEAAGLILEAGGEVSVDQRALLKAAEEEPEDQFRRTVKEHVNQRTSEEELQRRRERQRSLRRASIGEQGDGMFHLFAELDPLTGARVQAALISKSDQLFRGEDPKNRPTARQRFADALAELICTNDSAGGGAGAGSGGVELLVLADYDQVHDAITNARLTDGTRLTEAETLAVACDAKILPGIFNKHTGNPLPRPQPAQSLRPAPQTPRRPRRRLHRLRRLPHHLRSPPRPPLGPRRRNHPRQHLPRLLALPPHPHPPPRRTDHPPPQRPPHPRTPERHRRRQQGTLAPAATQPPPTTPIPESRRLDQTRHPPPTARRAGPATTPTNADPQPLVRPNPDHHRHTSGSARDPGGRGCRWTPKAAFQRPPERHRQRRPGPPQNPGRHKPQWPQTRVAADAGAVAQRGRGSDPRHRSAVS